MHRVGRHLAIDLRRVRALGVAALAINAALLADAIGPGWFVRVSSAQDASPPPAEPEAAPGGDLVEPLVQSTPGEPSEQPELFPSQLGPDEVEATYRALIEQLTATREDLERRLAEVGERERQLDVARQELARERAAIEKVRDEARAERAAVEALRSPSFDRLLKAYAGMDPDNAAQALARLYRKDRAVVADVLLGLNPRQSAQALDALAALDPAVAADVSYDVWKRDPTRGRR